MKRLFKLFVFAFVFLIGITSVSAASGYSVSSNSSTVIVGNTVKVTVKVSSNDLGAWSYCISYDSSILKLTSSTADASTCVKAGVVNLTGQTETFTFKALKSGSTKVTLKNAAIYSYKTEGQISGISIGSTNIRVMTQSELEATYSTNANLSSISFTGTDTNGETKDYPLTPEFNKDSLEYTINVPNEVEKGNIAFKKADNTASVNGGGDVTLNEGSNSFDLVVTAQKGNQLTYKVVVVREELDPIEVTIDNKTYTLVRRAGALPVYLGYFSSTVTYNDTEIPALYSDIIEYTLIGVKDSNGDIHMYIFKDGKIQNEYIEFKYGDITFTPIALVENDLFKYEVSGNSYVVNDNYLIYYGLDTSTNEKNYYLFNKKDGSFIVYDGTIEKLDNEKIENYKYVIYGLIGLCVFLLLICIFGRRGPKKEKVKKEKNSKLDKIDNNDASYFEEESSEDEIVEEVEEVEAPKEVVEEDDEVYVEDLSTKDMQEELKALEESKTIQMEAKKEEKKKSKRGKKKDVVEEPLPEEPKEEIQTKELDIDDDFVEEAPKEESKKEKKKREKEEKKKAKREAKEEAKRMKDFDW